MCDIIILTVRIEIKKTQTINKKELKQWVNTERPVGKKISKRKL